MSTDVGRVLLVDDDAAMAETLRKGLSKLGFDPTCVTQPASALEHLEREDFDVVVTDLRMPAMGGLELCQRALAIRPDVPVIVVTAFGSLESAVGAMRAGAYDFMTKPFDLDVAALTLSRAIEHKRLRDELARLRTGSDAMGARGGLVGESQAMARVFELLDRIRDSELSVLVTGESGTGKELVARALHRQSPRATGPFVAINCAALPEQLLESELFGHVKGAFTDAQRARPGLFVEASGGTLFLDEIGELPPGMQAKLLRVLQERRVRPVGSDREVEVDVRILAATNRDLAERVEEGAFREDLYFRLAVIELVVPPLRARDGDVLLLARRFLQRASERSHKAVIDLTDDAARLLLAYPWPGNVRELENAMERGVALARFDRLTPDDLPERVQSYTPQHTDAAARDVELITLEEMERRHIEAVLTALGGRRAEAARVLGLDRKTLYRKLERWGRSG
jgi:DNA-binding NtrC family response regulator